MAVGGSEVQETSILLLPVTHVTQSLHQPGQPSAQDVPIVMLRTALPQGPVHSCPAFHAQNSTHELSQAGGLRSGGLSPSLPRKRGAHSFLLHAEAHASQNPSPPQWACFSFWATGSSGLQYLQAPRFSNHLVQQTVLPLWAALAHIPV